MKYITLIIIPFLVYCNKTDNKPEISKECIFEEIPENMDGLIDDTEKNLMNECLKQALTTKQEMKENLIGEWKLIGYAAGSCCATSTMPCGYITVTENELIYELKHTGIDTTTIHTWEIQEFNNTNTLIISPYHHDLAFTTICPEYLFGNGTIIDSNMFLYQKIK